MTRPLFEVGFYGKLPCRGDFLQRRVPQEFVDAWDSWLQASIHESRQRLQDSWLDAYLTGPVWRFAFSSGVCGEGTYAGILVPSVDRVGRYFPLTVVAQLHADDCLLGIACGSSSWFESAESLVLEALASEALDFDIFDEQVALLRDHLDLDTAFESARVMKLLETSDFPSTASRWQVPLTTVGSLQSAVNALAYRDMTRILRPLALWWTQGSNVLAPAWCSTRGLPDAQAFVAMLSGDWDGAEWNNVRTGAGG